MSYKKMTTVLCNLLLLIQGCNFDVFVFYLNIQNYYSMLKYLFSDKSFSNIAVLFPLPHIEQAETEKH